MRVKKYRIENLKNQKDTNRLQSYLADVDGVKAVRIDSQADTVTVEFDENATSEQNIIAQIQQSGAEIK